MTITQTKTLILASSSPRRQELIRLLQLPVTVRVSHADESVDPGMEPSAIVEELSLRKARAVYETLPDDERRGGVVIGSDTIVVLDGAVLNKPVDVEDAARMLTALQGRSHQVYSGLACIDGATGRWEVSHQATHVVMKPLARERINRYIASGEPMDKAGAYAVQGIGAVLIERIEGDFFTVVGLPVALLAEMLQGFGLEVL